MKPDWSNDWKTFAEKLIQLFDSGATEEEISAQFRGKNVQWQGLITKVSLDEEWVPGINLSMAEENYPMANDRELSTSHIVLRIPYEDQET